MAPPRKYFAELRERAVRMVFELREQTGEKTGTIARVADQLGVHREALRTWVRQAEVDNTAISLGRLAGWKHTPDANDYYRTNPADALRLCRLTP